MDFPWWYIPAAWFVADLISGLIHWWEDRYGNINWPILGRWIVQPNIEHHTDPVALTRRHWFDRNSTSLLPALTIAGVFAWFGLWFWALAFFLSGFANEVHAWAHKRSNRAVRFLQSTGLILSPRHHAQHHRRPYQTHYCVMTNCWNPLLNRVHFWRLVEQVVFWVFRAKPLPERSTE